MEKTFTVVRFLMVTFIALILISHVGAQVHKTKKSIQGRKTTIAVHVAAMTNQEYYNRLGSIRDTLYNLRSNLLIKEVKVNQSKEWADLVPERKTLQTYCAQTLTYLDKLPDVGASSDIRLSLIALLQLSQNMEVINKDFDGFDKNTPGH